MTTTEVLMIAAVLIAPFLAVFAQRQIELWREGRRRRLHVFKTLMATRSKPLLPDHVQALNMIILEFNKESDAKILDAWREYLDHLGSYPEGDEEDLKQAVPVWSNSKEALQAALLEEMGKTLGYKFTSLELKKGAYSPQGHATVEFQQLALLNHMLEWLDGDRKVDIALVAADEDAASRAEAAHKAMMRLLDGKKGIKVAVESLPVVEPDDAAGGATPRR